MASSLRDRMVKIVDRSDDPEYWKNAFDRTRDVLENEIREKERLRLENERLKQIIKTLLDEEK